jgi:hypothetical protein
MIASEPFWTNASKKARSVNEFGWAPAAIVTVY